MDKIYFVANQSAIISFIIRGATSQILKFNQTCMCIYTSSVVSSVLYVANLTAAQTVHLVLQEIQTSLSVRVSRLIKK